MIKMDQNIFVGRICMFVKLTMMLNVTMHLLSFATLMLSLANFIPTYTRMKDDPQWLRFYHPPPILIVLLSPWPAPFSGMTNRLYT